MGARTGLCDRADADVTGRWRYGSCAPATPSLGADSAAHQRNQEKPRKRPGATRALGNLAARTNELGLAKRPFGRLVRGVEGDDDLLTGG